MTPRMLHKAACHPHKSENLVHAYWPSISLSGEVYNENKRGPRTEPWGTPNCGTRRSLDQSRRRQI